MRLAQILAQEQGAIPGLPSIPYLAPQGENLAQAESVSKLFGCGLTFVALADYLIQVRNDFEQCWAIYLKRALALA
jgi:hypothetical protein